MDIKYSRKRCNLYILYRSGKTGKVKSVNYRDRDFKGYFLGMEETSGEYEEMRFKIIKDDSLLLYSDCLTESKNLNNDEYGIERLQESLGRAKGSAGDMLQAVLKDFFDFVGNVELTDDLTVILLKMTL